MSRQYPPNDGQSSSIKTEESVPTLGHQDIPIEVDVAVWGAGAAGVGVALELADKGFKVVIYEKNKELLLGSSNATPGRAGHGFHYIDINTGRLYLRATIEVVKKFPECMLGWGKDENHYLRHGLYFIMKMEEDLKKAGESIEFATMFSIKAIKETYDELKEEYEQLIKNDPSNKVFGEPDEFFKPVELDKYAKLVNTSRIAIVMDTREELLNWPKLRLVLIEQVKAHSNIQVKCETTVHSPWHCFEKPGFTFRANAQLVRANYVVNATWENLDSLTQQIILPGTELAERTNRLKAILTVQLPPELHDKSSMFFCMGRHAMFSNMGNGKGMVTYAPKTNFKRSTTVELDPEMRKYLDGEYERSDEEVQELVKTILEGLAKYIPAFSKVNPHRDVEKIGFGIIRTDGDVEFDDPFSNFHKRDDLSLKERGIGWIDNPCMKLLYLFCNARVVVTLLERHKKVRENIRALRELVPPEELEQKEEYPKLPINMLSMILFQYYSSEQLTLTAECEHKSLPSMILFQNYSSGQLTLTAECEHKSLPILKQIGTTIFRKSRSLKELVDPDTKPKLSKQEDPKHSKQEDPTHLNRSQVSAKFLSRKNVLKPLEHNLQRRRNQSTQTDLSVLLDFYRGKTF